MDLLFSEALEAGAITWPPCWILMLITAVIQLFVLYKARHTAPKWILPILSLTMLLTGEITWRILDGWDRLLSVIVYGFGAAILAGCLLAIPFRTLVRRIRAKKQ